MTERDAPTPTGLNPDYNPEAVIARLREKLAGMERERDEAHQVIDESHRMIIDENTGRRWKELFREAEEQLADREQALERARELLGETLKDECRALEQLADELHDHNTTKRLLSEQVDKRWKLQQALEAVATAKNTKGEVFCHYCNARAIDGHHEYCLVGPALEAVKIQVIEEGKQ